MVLKCRKLMGSFLSLLILTVVVSCCPNTLNLGILYLPIDAATEKATSICASLAPIEAIQAGRTEEKQEIAADNSTSVQTRRVASKDTQLLLRVPLSLGIASICLAILYAVTSATSANLYIIKFIQLSDGMK